MIKISAPIPYSLPDALEEHFCELESSSWGIDKRNDATPPELFGYFEDAADAAGQYGELRKSFPELPEIFASEEVFEQDWKNEYKKYLKPWSCRTLHWVPDWERATYPLPDGHKAFYFDAGLAFGTGDHPTTRLCAIRMLDWLAGQPDPGGKFLIDAGCGSGILAISARLMGFGRVFAFDNDPEAVRVSLENSAQNGTEGQIEFARAGIDEALAGKSCDILLANIQADILMIYADELIAAVKPGGTLVLSGILAVENDEVRARFAKAAGGRAASCDAAFMGEWSDVMMRLS